MKKYYLITGSSGKFGLYLAKYLAESGINLILHYNKSEEKIINLINEIKQNYQVDAIPLKYDLSQNQSGIKLIKAAIKLGEIQTIIHLASFILEDSVFNIKSDNLQKSLNVHAISLLEIGNFVTKYQYCDNIIAFSDANMSYDTKCLSYNISKRMLNDVVQYLAPQLKDICRVNAISPSWIGNLDFELDKNSRIKNKIFSQQSTRFPQTIDDIIKAMMFLINTNISGVNLKI